MIRSSHYQMVSKFVQYKNLIKNNMISSLFINNIIIIVIVTVCVVSILMFKTILMQFKSLKDLSQKHYHRYNHSHRCCIWCNHKHYNNNCHNKCLDKSKIMTCLAFMPAVSISGKYIIC